MIVLIITLVLMGSIRFRIELENAMDFGDGFGIER